MRGSDSIAAGNAEVGAKLAGLFAIGDRLKRLSETGDPLETLDVIIDFEAFRSVLRQRNTVEEKAQIKAGLKAREILEGQAEQGRPEG